MSWIFILVYPKNRWPCDFNHTWRVLSAPVCLLLFKESFQRIQMLLWIYFILTGVTVSATKVNKKDLFGCSYMLQNVICVFSMFLSSEYKVKNKLFLLTLLLWLKIEDLSLYSGWYWLKGVNRHVKGLRRQILMKLLPLRIVFHAFQTDIILFYWHAIKFDSGALLFFFLCSFVSATQERLQQSLHAEGR